MTESSPHRKKKNNRALACFIVVLVERERVLRNTTTSTILKPHKQKWELQTIATKTFQVLSTRINYIYLHMYVYTHCKQGLIVTTPPATCTHIVIRIHLSAWSRVSTYNNNYIDIKLLLDILDMWSILHFCLDDFILRDTRFE